MTVEYDDGRVPEFRERHPKCTRRGRDRGFYFYDGETSKSVLIPVSFMRISEMEGVQDLFQDIFSLRVEISR